MLLAARRRPAHRAGSRRPGNQVRVDADCGVSIVNPHLHSLRYRGSGKRKPVKLQLGSSEAGRGGAAHDHLVDVVMLLAVDPVCVTLVGAHRLSFSDAAALCRFRV